jgi:hypothetical protein
MAPVTAHAAFVVDKLVQTPVVSLGPTLVQEVDYFEERDFRLQVLTTCGIL